MAFSGKIYWVGDHDYIARWDSSSGTITAITTQDSALPAVPRQQGVYAVQVFKPDGAPDPQAYNPAVVTGPTITGSGAVLGDSSDATGVVWSASGSSGQGLCAGAYADFTYAVNGFQNEPPLPYMYGMDTKVRLRVSASAGDSYRNVNCLFYEIGTGAYGADRHLGTVSAPVGSGGLSLQWYEQVFYGDIGMALQKGLLRLLVTGSGGTAIYDVELHLAVRTGVTTLTSPMNNFGTLTLLGDGRIATTLDSSPAEQPWALAMPEGLVPAESELFGGAGNGGQPFEPYPNNYRVLGHPSSENWGGIYDPTTGLTWFDLPYTDMELGEPLDYPAIWSHIDEGFYLDHYPSDVLNYWVWAGVDNTGIIRQRLGFPAPNGQYDYYNTALRYSQGYVGNAFLAGRWLYRNYSSYGSWSQNGLARFNIDSGEGQFMFVDGHRQWVGYDPVVGGIVSVDENTGDVEIFTDIEAFNWTTDPYPSAASTPAAMTHVMPNYGDNSFYWEQGWGQAALPGDGYMYYIRDLEYGVDWDDGVDNTIGNSLRIERMELATGTVEDILDVPYVLILNDGTLTTDENSDYWTGTWSVPFGLLVVPGGLNLNITGQIDKTRVRPYTPRT